MSALFKQPVIAAPPLPPPPPTPEDTSTAKKLEEAAAAERRPRNGRSSTILTSGVGLEDSAPASKKYLLGN
jgi:hypothetical protein